MYRFNGIYGASLYRGRFEEAHQHVVDVHSSASISCSNNLNISCYDLFINHSNSEVTSPPVLTASKIFKVRNATPTLYDDILYDSFEYEDLLSKIKTYIIECSGINIAFSFVESKFSSGMETDLFFLDNIHFISDGFDLYNYVDLDIVYFGFSEFGLCSYFTFNTNILSYVDSHYLPLFFVPNVAISGYIEASYKILREEVYSTLKSTIYGWHSLYTDKHGVVVYRGYFYPYAEVADIFINTRFPGTAPFTFTVADLSCDIDFTYGSCILNDVLYDSTSYAISAYYDFNYFAPDICDFILTDYGCYGIVCFSEDILDNLLLDDGLRHLSPRSLTDILLFVGNFEHPYAVIDTYKCMEFCHELTNIKLTCEFVVCPDILLNKFHAHIGLFTIDYKFESGIELLIYELSSILGIDEYPVNIVQLNYVAHFENFEHGSVGFELVEEAFVYSIIYNDPTNNLIQPKFVNSSITYNLILADYCKDSGFDFITGFEFLKDTVYTLSDFSVIPDCAVHNYILSSVVMTTQCDVSYIENSTVAEIYYISLDFIDYSNGYNFIEVIMTDYCDSDYYCAYFDIFDIKHIYNEIQVDLKSTMFEFDFAFKNLCVWKGVIDAFEVNIETETTVKNTIKQYIEFDLLFTQQNCIGDFCHSGNIDFIDCIKFSDDVLETTSKLINNYLDLNFVFAYSSADISFCPIYAVDIIKEVFSADFIPFIWWFVYDLVFDYHQTGREELGLVYP